MPGEGDAGFSGPTPAAGAAAASRRSGIPGSKTVAGGDWLETPGHGTATGYIKLAEPLTVKIGQVVCGYRTDKNIATAKYAPGGWEKNSPLEISAYLCYNTAKPHATCNKRKQ